MPSTPLSSPISAATMSPTATPSPRNSNSNGNGTSNNHKQQQQQQQQQPPTQTPTKRRETERERAKREARECLQAVRHEGFQLDGFNLLGVVANPRAGMLGSAASASSASRYYNNNNTNTPTSPSRQQQQQHDTNGEHGTTTTAMTTATTSGSSGTGGGGATGDATQTTPEASSDMFSDAVNSLGYTLGQVTEQIETLNLFLEELSRQYLGDDGGESLFLEYYYQDEEDQGEKPPLPAQLANLQLTELQAYLEKCGVLAHSLFAQGLETSSLPVPTTASSSAIITTMQDNNTTTDDEDLTEIPDIFFDADFDLTESETFVQLLLQNGLENKDTTTTAATTQQGSSSRFSLYQPTSELVPAREQDALAGHLDRVELALQEQVRLKAGAFFQETTRFRQLQSSIEELLDQVQTLRHGIQSILSVYRQTKDISNHQRQDYELFVQLMDAALDLIQTKSSIGGLLSANDHLGAAQQIQYGRRLLKQGIARAAAAAAAAADEGTTDLSMESSAAQHKSQSSLELQNMTALSSCGEQFQQYESLVVQNLSEEIVDVFFNWRPSEQERVQEMVQALNLCRALDKAGDLYNRRLQQTIRMTVRTTIAEFVESSGSSGSGVTGMTYPDFFNCLEMLIEELQSVLQMARRVDDFAAEESIFPHVEESSSRWTNDGMVNGADLAAKSIAELLRLRKEAHSLISLEEMRQLWDTCLRFTLTVEGYGNNVKAVGLRSTLVGQAKAFLDRTHESNMSALVAALDSERWTPCEVSAERQAALTRLCTGRAISAATVKRPQEEGIGESNSQKKPTAEVEGVHYKVVWSSLLLVEMIMTNLSAAGHFQSLATNAVTKVAELLRLFNTRTTNLVLGAGAIHSAARLKSINAKHLSMVTQCLGMTTALLPHIRAALMAQLPSKQHALLNDLDKIKKDYLDHSEKVLNKFVTIIGGIVEHGLAPRIADTDFDARAKEGPSDTEEIACCVFLDGVSTNTRKMHQVLNAMLPPDHLQDVFSRIFAYVDQKVPTLFIAAASGSSTANGKPTFRFPTSDDGKCRFIMEVESMTIKLNGLDGVLPWDFTCTNVLERKLDYTLKRETPTVEDEPSHSLDDGHEKDVNIPATVEANGSPVTSQITNGEKHEDEKQEDANEAKSNPEPVDGE